MSKSINEYTLDELRQLLVYEPFGRDIYPVQPDGTVTLPNGRVLRGLVGKWLNVPRVQDRIRAMWVDERTPLYWSDENGNLWSLVQTNAGEYKRRPA